MAESVRLPRAKAADLLCPQDTASIEVSMGLARQLIGRLDSPEDEEVKE